MDNWYGISHGNWGIPFLGLKCRLAWLDHLPPFLIQPCLPGIPAMISILSLGICAGQSTCILFIVYSPLFSIFAASHLVRIYHIYWNYSADPALAPWPVRVLDSSPPSYLFQKAIATGQWNLDICQCCTTQNMN